MKNANTIIAETTSQFYVHFKGSDTSKPFYAIVHKMDKKQTRATYNVKPTGGVFTPAMQLGADVRRVIKKKHSGGEATFAKFNSGGDVLEFLIGENTRRRSVSARCNLV